MTPAANKLAPWLAGLLAFVAVALVIMEFSGEDGADLPASPSITPDPTSDTEEVTMRTLVARLEEALRQNRTLQDDQVQLRREIASLRSDAAPAPTSAEPPPAVMDALASVSEHLEGLKQRLETLETQSADDLKSLGIGGGDLPIGLAETPAASAPRDTMVVFEPIDAAFGDAPAGPRLLSTAGGAIASAADKATGLAGDATDGASRAAGLEKSIEPRYTLDSGDTLLGAVAWTALLGRIPVQGKVVDPWRFKVLTGAENLAANGHHIPGLVGMVWSGTAVGDLNLRCVSGALDAVAYVFADGTRRTVRAEGGRSLGWISDAQGTPCLSGELITNAPAWLAQRTALIALQAGADAAAAAQTTTVVDTGSAVTAVDGTIGPYVLGKSLSGGAGEAQRWVDERQGQSFDAILVRPGLQVVVNVEDEIHIDYDSKGRKVAHALELEDSYRSPGLD